MTPLTPQAEAELEAFRVHLADHDRQEAQPDCRFCADRLAKPRAASSQDAWSPPRRICVDKFTPAERAIYDAVQEVEKAGAHRFLTDAVILLQQAREKVADYVERNYEGTPR